MWRPGDGLRTEAALPVFLLLACLAVSSAPQQTSQEVHNARVIAMTTLGLGDEVIVARIKTSPCKLALSDNDLVALKRAGVSEKVIAAMLGARVLTTTRVSVDGWPLEQRSLAQSKVLGGLGKSLSLGIKSTRTKAERIVVHKSEQP